MEALLRHVARWALAHRQEADRVAAFRDNAQSILPAYGRCNRLAARGP
jgi:hypothetical protein